MATVDQLKAALIKAHEAGDTEAAQLFANQINSMNGAENSEQRAARVRSEFDAMPMYKKPFVAADDMVRKTVDGITFGFGDKISAGLNSALGYGGYDDLLKQERQATDDARSRAGLAGDIASIAGSILPVSGLMKAGVTATSIPKMPSLLGSAIDGSAIGALDAVGHDGSVLAGAGLGAFAGAAGDVIGNQLTKLARPKIADPGKHLEMSANNAYKKLDNSGALYSPQAIARVLDDAQGIGASKGFLPRNQPGMSAALEELERVKNVGLPVNTTGMQSLRQAIQGGLTQGASLNKKNNAMINATVGKIDDLMMAPRQGELLGGDVNAGRYMKEANKFFSQSEKFKKVEQALDEAADRASTTGSGGNLENTIRQELRKLRKDPFWSKDERAALKSAYGGGVGRSVLRGVGQASPMGNGLMKMLWGSGLGGAAISGVGLGPMVVAAIASSGAKKVGQARAKSAARDLQQLIAVGGSKANLPKPSKNAENLIEALKKSVLVGLPQFSQ